MLTLGMLLYAKKENVMRLAKSLGLPSEGFTQHVLALDILCKIEQDRFYDRIKKYNELSKLWET